MCDIYLKEESVRWYGDIQVECLFRLEEYKKSCGESNI